MSLRVPVKKNRCTKSRRSAGRLRVLVCGMVRSRLVVSLSFGLTRLQNCDPCSGPRACVGARETVTAPQRGRSPRIVVRCISRNCPGIVIYRIVHGATVVPKGEGSLLPPKAAGELGRGRVTVEELEKRRALSFSVRPLETDREHAVDVKRLSAGVSGVRAHTPGWVTAS